MGKNKRLSNLTVTQANTYLRSRGIPKEWIRAIFDAFVDAGTMEASWMMSDRLYTLVGLSLHRGLGFGYKRILKVFREMSKIITEVTDEEDVYWAQLMDELYQETGMVIHSNDIDGGSRVITEYKCPNGEREMTEEELEKYNLIVSGFEEDLEKMRGGKNE